MELGIYKYNIHIGTRSYSIMRNLILLAVRHCLWCQHIEIFFCKMSENVPFFEHMQSKFAKNGNMSLQNFFSSKLVWGLKNSDQRLIGIKHRKKVQNPNCVFDTPYDTNWDEKKFWGHISSFCKFSMHMLKNQYIFRRFGKSKNLLFCQKLLVSVWILLQFQKKNKIEVPSVHISDITDNSGGYINHPSHKFGKNKYSRYVMSFTTLRSKSVIDQWNL